MKNLAFTCITMFLIIACSGVKKTQEAINTGDYNNAIGNSLQNLRDNKTKKANQPYIVLLEEAFKKNQERELQHIAFLKQDGNPANYEAIFSSYNALKQIQQQIRPLLPLHIYEENRRAQFNFKNYDDNIISAKQELSNYLYTNATSLLTNATHKQDYRKAYEDFKYLEKINPGYSNTKQRMEEAYTKGLDYVKVVMANHTDQIIPAKLEQELLNFNTYGLNDLWTEYHNNPLPNINYDYAMEVSLKAIDISPEQISEKQIIKEKQVKDGYEYALDNDGKVVKDSLGNKIKIDKFKTVKCNFYQFTQYKTAQVSGVVNFTELNKQQLVNSYPLASEFKFEHIYARHDGDKRALENNLISQLGLAAIPFPTNEQMVYDAGEDLKSRIKSIMTQQRFN
ncbi:hypothetical protein [Kriegella aquimaris]|uniref:Uncharacterized protein n=1 Tax=Kriegella aquimaris TaxID=192904 RepID=A0A1G9K375_9FLAO|nr:hypothetical protein [Kriegella aquimaris]SDL44277.1 hypothetical protein SAMN04488514_101824 [Kriegella aquimaris]